MVVLEHKAQTMEAALQEIKSDLRSLAAAIAKLGEQQAAATAKLGEQQAAATTKLGEDLAKVGKEVYHLRWMLIVVFLVGALVAPDLRAALHAAVPAAVSKLLG